MRPNPWFAFPVLAAGVAGGFIGRNVARVTCTPVDAEAVCDTGSSELWFAAVGAIAAMAGVAVVIVLVIRSLSEWRATSRDD